MTMNDSENGNETEPLWESMEDWEAMDIANITLSLAVITALGALIRFQLKKIRLPYTVVLLICGVLLGFVSSKIKSVKPYTVLARMHPQLIFHVFLPILIFESSFAMDAHTLTKVFLQCTVLAVPGLLISAALTAVLSMNLFVQYDWTWGTALLFGSILSATDPVAVVALLRELGTSKILSTVIEGESLLNDGSAIVAYDVLIDLAMPGSTVSGGEIVLKFCQIALGGPLLGYLMGKVAVFCLSHIFNDAVTEITVTLSAAFLTYFLAEDVLNVSGVLALVCLGMVLSSRKDSISPEVEDFVHKFWEMLAYLANTVIFVVVGLVITERAAVYIESQDWFLICVTYVAITVFRFCMIGLLSPVLSRMGYGMGWKDAIVMTWGGLRGAVGLTLALLVAENPSINRDVVGHKILIHVAGIVTLTLLLNATTIKPLLRLLGMSDISVQKRSNMANAVRHLKEVQDRSILVQKNCQLLIDADWKYVEMCTAIEDPYCSCCNHKEHLGKDLCNPLRISTCPDCTTTHVIQPTTHELQEMMEEARLRIISAQKLSYWRQFENGLLERESVRILINSADAAADKEGAFITVHELRKHWEINAIYRWLKHLADKSSSLTKKKLKNKLEVPKSGVRATAWKIVHHISFVCVTYFIIGLNLIAIDLEIVVLMDSEKDEYYLLILRCVNVVFVIFYFLEMVIKVSALTWKGYWRSHWNKLDLLILAISFIDLILDLVLFFLYWTSLGHLLLYLRCSRMLRLLRVVRLLHLIKMLFNKLMFFLTDAVNTHVHSGYDIAHGFLVGEEEVLKVIEEVVDYPPIASQLKQVCEENKKQLKKELAVIQEIYPGVAVAIKTKHASRLVLNSVRHELESLSESGLLEDSVYESLMAIIEKRMKLLQRAPRCMLPMPPTEFLRNIQWISGNRNVFDFIKERAAVLRFKKGDTICPKGGPPSGIYVITVGLVKVEGKVAFDNDGSLTNSDTFTYFGSQDRVEDFLTVGSVLGELGILTKKPRSTSAVCETEVQAFHINQNSIEDAFKLFKVQPSVEYQLWRTCAARITEEVLANHIKYYDWTPASIKAHVEEAFLHILEHGANFEIGGDMDDVVLIQGVAFDSHTSHVYKGVAYIPKSVRSLSFQEGDCNFRPLLMVIGSQNYLPIPDSEWAYYNGRGTLRASYSHCLLHQVRRKSSLGGTSSVNHEEACEENSLRAKLLSIFPGRVRSYSNKEFDKYFTLEAFGRPRAMSSLSRFAIYDNPAMLTENMEEENRGPEDRCTIINEVPCKDIDTSEDNQVNHRKMRHFSMPTRRNPFTYNNLIDIPLDAGTLPAVQDSKL